LPKALNGKVSRADGKRYAAFVEQSTLEWQKVFEACQSAINQWVGNNDLFFWPPRQTPFAHIKMTYELKEYRKAIKATTIMEGYSTRDYYFLL
jgi:hypothetical protein